jgi:HEAT repeats
MPLVARCPSCHHQKNVPEVFAGKQVRCPKCQTMFAITDVNPWKQGSKAVRDITPLAPDDPWGQVITPGDLKLKESTAFTGDPPPVRQQPDQPAEFKRCPFCAEQILAGARKCKHCGEMVDEQPRSRPERVMREYRQARPPQNRSDGPGVISLIFGTLSVVCTLAGCFTCGTTYFIALPFALIGTLLGLFARGNLRVAGLTLNLLALLPAVLLTGTFGGLIGSFGLQRPDAAQQARDREANQKAVQERLRADAENREKEKQKRQREKEQQEREKKARIQLELDLIERHKRELRGDNEDARRQAILSLGELGPKAASAVPDLTLAIKDKRGLRKEAADALGKIGKAAVPALIEALKDTQEVVRQNAAYALALKQATFMRDLT